MSFLDKHKNKLVWSAIIILPILLVIMMIASKGDDSKKPTNTTTTQTQNGDPDAPAPTVDIEVPVKIDLPDLGESTVEENAVTEETFSDVKWKDGSTATRAALVAADVFSNNSITTYAAGYARLKPYLSASAQEQIKFLLQPVEDTRKDPPTKVTIKFVKAYENPQTGDRIVQVSTLMQYAAKGKEPALDFNARFDMYLMPDQPLITNITVDLVPVQQKGTGI